MGKKLLHHPVSLHVIRGGLEYAGFEVGRIVQYISEPSQGLAAYHVQITGIPDNFWSRYSLLPIDRLQACFASDVSVVACRWNWKRGKQDALVQCDLVTESLPWEPDEGTGEEVMDDPWDEVGQPSVNPEE
jgi:hypothetical protein